MNIYQRLQRLRTRILVIALAMLVVQGLPLVVGSSWALFTASTANGNNLFATLSVRPPTASSAAGQAAGAVVVTWKASPTAAIRPVQYDVFRRPAGVGSYARVNGTHISGLTYTDLPPADGSYDYLVKTFVGGFTSGGSNVVTGLSDRTAPSTTISCNGRSCASVFNGTVTVDITATDAGSGVASITHSLDGGPNITTTGASVSFSVSGDGGHPVRYFATDNYGNAGAAQTQIVSISTAKARVQRGRGARCVCGSLTVSFRRPTTAGNLLVATIADSQNGTTVSAPPGWVQAVSATQASTGQVTIFYYPNNPGGITSATFTDPGATLAGQLSEWRGVAGSSPLEQTGSAVASTSQATVTVSTSGSDAGAGDLAITAFRTDGTSLYFTPGAGWTRQVQDGTDVADYRLNAPAGVVSETETASSAVNWVGVVVTFK